MYGENVTPLMKQYFEVKASYPDSIVLFRVGDFYEAFYDDAKEISGILDIVLTARDKEKKIPMAGIPFHSLDSYLEKLIKANKRVVIVEQMEDPKVAVGLVRRGVVKVFTPSTTLTESFSKLNNFLFAVKRVDDKVFDCSFSDIKEGLIYVFKVFSYKDFLDNIAIIQPKEILICSTDFNEREIQQIQSYLVTVLITRLSEEKFVENAFMDFVNDELRSFMLMNTSLSLKALLNYFAGTQLTKLEHLNKIIEYSTDDFMRMEPEVFWGLEIFQGQRAESISLIEILDCTSTPGGARLLREWLKRPLIDIDAINKRLDKVHVLFNKGKRFLESLSENLKGTSDVAKIITKIGLNTVNAKDLRALEYSLKLIKQCVQVFDGNDLNVGPFSAEIEFLRNSFAGLEELINLIDRTIVENPPISIKDGGLIKPEVDNQLEYLYKIKQGGQGWIKEFESDQIEKTGINSLKVRYNKVIGYYIEVPKTQLSKVPADYIRRQTLSNAERFITLELKEYESKVISADDQIRELEYAIFISLLEKIKPFIKVLQDIYKVISEIDVYASLAWVAILNNWTKPVISHSFDISIENGFHPVIDIALKKEGKLFVRNSYISNEGSTLHIITGPNMGGKSTYLRQTALIVILAQIGSYVPAERAEIGIVDKIFTRIGASDNLARGESTFMVEMIETAKIINYASKRSLVLLDEVGRGTSTFDGISIAWAICEYLAVKRIKTLFATHYHEIASIADKFDNVKNFCIKVTEFNGEIILLHQIKPGQTDRSYGIHVAKLAGMPDFIINRAKQILKKLEKNKIEKNLNTVLDDLSLDIFSEHNRSCSYDNKQQEIIYNSDFVDFINEIKNIEVEKITPIQALNLIYEIKKKLSELMDKK